MGNSNSTENENFNPKFDMNSYNQKMNQMKGQYNQSANLSAPGAFYSQKASQKDMVLQQVKRRVYIFKDTIEMLTEQNGTIKFTFDYESRNQAKLQISLGVRNIEENKQTKESIVIDCLKNTTEYLPQGDKAHFSNTFQLQKQLLKELTKFIILLKISSDNEYSEYSLFYNRNTKHWKPAVEVCFIQNKLIGLTDIYGGTEDQDCIICFSEKSTAMVQPCNHLCLCGECAKLLRNQSNNCPICRKKIGSLLILSTKPAVS